MSSSQPVGTRNWLRRCVTSWTGRDKLTRTAQRRESHYHEIGEANRWNVQSQKQQVRQLGPIESDRLCRVFIVDLIRVD